MPPRQLSADWEITLGMLAMVIVLAAAHVVLVTYFFMSSGISSLEVEATGLRVTTLWGKKHFIGWGDITHIKSKTILYRWFFGYIIPSGALA